MRRGRLLLCLAIATAQLAIGACAGPAPASPVEESPAAQAASTASGTASTVSGTTATPTPGGAPAWIEGTVEQAAGSEVTGPGQTPLFCSPCHASQETSLDGVAAGHGSFVAVGIQFPPPEAAAWTSVDGRTWRRSGGLDAPRGSVLTAVAATADGFVAVGGAGMSAAAWTSLDGGTWDRARVVSPAAPGTARMDAVARFAGGLVAAGDAEIAPPAGRAVAWTSVDGTDWMPARDIASFARATIAGLAPGASIVVAVGSSTRADGTHSAATWWSADGRAWHQGAPDPSFADSQMLGVAAGGPGFVAVGTADGGLRAATWTSTDGIHWTASPGGTGSTDYGQRIVMTGVARSGTGFVASGWRDSAGNGSSVMWVSPDGVTWQRVTDVASFGGAEATGVAAAVDGVVAVGATGLPDNWVSAAWLGRSVLVGGPVSPRASGAP
jgi:hypothetical protein